MSQFLTFLTGLFEGNALGLIASLSAFIVFGGLVVRAMNKVREEIHTVRVDLTKSVGRLDGDIREINTTIKWLIKIIEINGSAAPVPADSDQNSPPVTAKFQDERTPLKYADGTSPLTLTPLSWEIIRELDAEVVLRTHLGELTELVDAEEPETLYDIQQVCLRIARLNLTGIMTKDERNRIKDRAFMKTEDKFSDLLYIHGLLLRDIILQERGLLPPDFHPRKHENTPSLAAAATATVATVAAEPTPAYNTD